MIILKDRNHFKEILDYSLMDEGTVEGNIYSITGIYDNGSLGVFPFGGYFLRDLPLETKTFQGQIADYHGLALIVGSYTGDEEIRFDKIYQNRPQLNYRFKFDKTKGLWVGGYMNTINSQVGEAACEIHHVLKGSGITRKQIHPGEWARNTVDRMIGEGYLREVRNPSGEIVLEPEVIPEEDDIPF